MTLEEIKEELCYHDPRHPDYEERILDDDDREYEESKYQDSLKGECYCDACHQGTNKLAIELLKYVK